MIPQEPLEPEEMSQAAENLLVAMRILATVVTLIAVGLLLGDVLHHRL